MYCTHTLYNTSEEIQGNKIDFSLGFVRGNTFYANLAAHSNLNVVLKPKYTAPPEILNQPYLQPFQELDASWQKYLSELIMWQMGNEGLVTHTSIAVQQCFYKPLLS